MEESCTNLSSVYPMEDQEAEKKKCLYNSPCDSQKDAHVDNDISLISDCHIVLSNILFSNSLVAKYYRSTWIVIPSSTS